MITLLSHVEKKKGGGGKDVRHNTSQSEKMNTGFVTVENDTQNNRCNSDNI